MVFNRTGAVLLMMLAVVGVASAQTVYRLQERVWLPYDPDTSTLGLFHLDQHPRVGADQAMEDADVESGAKPAGKAAPQLLSGLGVEGGAKSQEAGVDRARDSGTQARAARLLGKTTWLEKGLYRGGLRLEGGDAALATPDYPAFRSGQGFAVEAWFMVDKNAAGTLISLPGGTKAAPSIEVRLTAGGEARLFFEGKPASDVVGKINAGEWTHVALSIYPQREVAGKYAFEPRLAASTVLVQINTRSIGVLEDKRVAQVAATLSGQAYFGNDQLQSSGVACQIDEARVSSANRYFYPLLLGTVRTPADRAVPVGPPLVRGKDDQLFYVPFEDSITPHGPPDANPAAALASALGVVPDPPDKGKAAPLPKTILHPSFVDGVHGRSFLAGAGLASVKYSPTPTAPVIDLSRGSIELWFSPSDWDNRERQKQLAPMECVPLVRTVAPAGEKDPPHLAISIMRMQPFLEANPPALYMNPGTWYHLVVAWDGPKTAAFINGLPAPAGIVAIDRRGAAVGSPAATTSALLVGAAHPAIDPGAHSTVIDEVRTYRRALTPEEAANAFGRYLPEPKTTPLPFARMQAWLSTPTKSLHINTSLLAGDASKTRSVRVTVLQENKDDVVFGPYILELSSEGVGEKAFVNDAVNYGKFRLKSEYLAADGTVVHSQIGDMHNLVPEWLGNTLGVHEGKVLPGWSDMSIDRGVISLSMKKITLAPTGWPSQFNAAEQDMLARPIEVHAKNGGAELAWKPLGDAVVVESAKPDRVITRGEAAAGDWKMSTRLTSEFDGMIKVETTFTPNTPGANANLDELTIDIPLKNEHATYYGLWSGHQWFRAACDYMPMPQKEGVILASNKHGRAVNTEIEGSFIPFVVLADDRRAINWFAENDRGWTKTREKPAVEIVRDATTTTLRLHIIQAPTPITEPLTITFGLHLAPVKAGAAKRRSIAAKADFGFVDAFSKQPLKTDFASLASFGLLPAGDWEVAAARAEKHRREYKMNPGYEGPLLYIDRNYVAVPPSAGNFVPIWMRSGAMRYLPDARDMGIWCMNEWMKRKLIVGIYIDDVWGQPMKDPDAGPAYKLANGKVQPGFEFFDFNTYMRRLRWLFHDNNIEPLIWLHATQTFYLPICSYADLVLDGEDRFPAVGLKGDFLAYWGLPRLQFNEPEKWGVTTTWMFKAPADGAPVPGPFRHWYFRQIRAYQAGCLLHDLALSNDRPASVLKLGSMDDSAKFYGYWQREHPAVSADKEVIASLYVTKAKNGKTRVGVVLVNTDDKPRLASIKFDLAKLGLSGTLNASDIDTMSPPEGEDPTKTVVPKKMSGEDPGKPDATSEMFKDLENDINHPDPSRGEGNWFTDRNLKLENGTLRARIRPRDYRVILIE